MVPPETYVKVAGHLRSFQVKSEKNDKMYEALCHIQWHSGQGCVQPGLDFGLIQLVVV